MNESSNIKELKGIGEKTESLFQKLGVYTVGDLLHYFPRGYDVYEEPVTIGELEEEKVMTVTGALYGKVTVSGNRNMQVTTAYVKDLTGTLKVIWFRMPFLRHTLKGGVITLRGRIINRKGVLVMEHPEIFYPSIQYEQKKNTLQPIYPLTVGITNHTILKAMEQAIAFLNPNRELLPEKIREDYGLMKYPAAIQGIHFPADKQMYYQARERLVFEEFFVFILAIRRQKEVTERQRNAFSFQKPEKIDEFIQSLPYNLTHAQQKVWGEIQRDLYGKHMMSRLIQGDVGSGKTIVAVLALLLVSLNGYQGALMAPTEVLARQHFESITALLKDYRVPIATELLTGSMTGKEKKAAYERIQSGQTQIVIGTHALIQEKVKYQNLALVVTDEQHRFGVKQREQLAGKGNVPHILVMSATPIPRTLAIILYGDLDISVIDELPANRLPIKNCVVNTNYRKTAYRFIKQQVQQGRQCYVICPMVEESEHLEAENVMDYVATLQEEWGNAIVTACLHGRMKQKEKDVIMERFVKNQIQVLVSTTVIEVGIDVPNATVMLVETAERFGLSQLHQLRGRVGRGKHQSYCIFMSSSKSKETQERLSILNQSNDGFHIAREDLKLRGPGDLFGIRQSGILDFRLGDVFQDSGILQKANEAAGLLLTQDEALKAYLDAYIQEGMLETTL
ncbi:MAG: ATP-dependent DNA helicase RecG [Lachnospiraceae bacterium]